jgi:electron transfer flavoprotein alpha/beta subunit
VAPPALLIVTRGLCRVPDLPLGALEEAFSRTDIVRWGLEDLGLAREEVGLEGSATRVWTLRTPPPRREGKTVSGSPADLVDHLIRRLEALSILEEADGKD